MRTRLSQAKCRWDSSSKRVSRKLVEALDWGRERHQQSEGAVSWVRNDGNYKVVECANLSSSCALQISGLCVWGGGGQRHY